MSPTQEKKYKDQKLDILYFELYNLESENAFSVNIIETKEKERAVLEASFKKASGEYDKLSQSIKPRSKKSKVDPVDQKKLGLAKNRVDGINFVLTQIKGRLSTLYQEVAQKANQIRAISKNIAALENLDLSKTPQLKYLEINGTRYQAKNNAHVLDSEGNMILYVETNTTQETA